MCGRPSEAWLVCNAWTGGGAERVASVLVGHLDRDVVRPSICLLRDDVSYPLPDDVAVHHVGYRGAATFFTAASRLRRLIDDHRPDVVVSTVNANALPTGAALVRSRHRPPWIAGIGSSPRGLDRGLRGIAARRLYRGADLFVTNSARLATEFEAFYPFAVGHTATIHNPCDFELIDRLAEAPVSLPRPRGPLLVAAGRLTVAKRYDLMLKALSIVRRTVPASLWICGSGPLRQRLEHNACSLGLEDAVRWLGFLDNPFAVLRQGDVFVLTSDFEGLPNALIEAQGLGLPAVSTDCATGPDEIVDHGVTGILVPVGDAHAIASALLELIADEETRRCMGAEARTRARALFDHRKLVGDWQDLLIRAARGDV